MLLLSVNRFKIEIIDMHEIINSEILKLIKCLIASEKECIKQTFAESLYFSTCFLFTLGAGYPKKEIKFNLRLVLTLYASFKFLDLAYSGLVNWTVYIHDFLCIPIRSTDELNYILYNFYPIRDHWKLGSLGNRLRDGALCIGNVLGSAPRNNASEGVRETGLATAELTL